ncbi:MAG TPA: succinate dehydrogenase assembly factor 2 [Burkholderiales bacterium]|nr:succinate dehydrogenase assembly factor 2 [Burkholderiales bacterium]
MSLERHRLKWKCRRGLLELDLVLGRFLEKFDPQGSDAQRLSALLDLPDNDLLDIAMGRSERYAAELKDVVARLRAA